MLRPRAIRIVKSAIQYTVNNEEYIDFFNLQRTLLKSFYAK